MDGKDTFHLQNRAVTVERRRWRNGIGGRTLISCTISLKKLKLNKAKYYPVFNLGDGPMVHYIIAELSICLKYTCGYECRFSFCYFWSSPLFCKGLHLF